MDKINELSDLLNQYVTKGFGSMNKNDFEVFIFYLLLNDKKYKLSKCSDYEISLKLKIPISKVKRLRYEASLKYCNELDTMNKKMFIEALHNIKVRKDKKTISFIIENVSVRKYLDNQLKKDGRFSDSSFNSEIVVLTIEDFKYLLKENISASDKKELLSQCNIKSFEELVDKLIEKILEKSVEKSVGYISCIFPNLIEDIIRIVNS